MTYQALARKWRPRRFPELVGQQHVVKALSHALDGQRLHHALLLSGTRGVGKTTLGRIVAKCLNCERGVSAEPCVDDPCSACAEIDEGRFLDLIEVDAASRTGVDDTRELMENVQYAPSRGRYKVYLIDEVHMLSKHSFNALLKTLEEPPPHVQFVLATTDPQKIPVTILSRCLQFPLKRLPGRDIAAQMQKILEAEGLEAEPAALSEIARAAEGSMRDALSLLDQALAFGGGAVTAAEVHDMLGSIARESLFAVLSALAEGDANSLMSALSRLDEQAPDYGTVIDGLAAALHGIAVLQLVPDAQPEDAEALGPLAEKMSPEDVQIYYDIALAGRRDLDWAPDPKSGLEMTCLRMLAFRPDLPSGSSPNVDADKRQAQRQTGRRAAAAPEQAQPQAAGGESDWDELVNRLPLRAMNAELARNCVCHRLDAEAVELELPETHKHLLTDKARKQIREALAETLGGQPRVTIRLGAGGDSPAARSAAREDERQQRAQRAIEDDPNVQALKQRLGAEVHPDSIRPEDG